MFRAIQPIIGSFFFPGLVPGLSKEAASYSEKQTPSILYLYLSHTGQAGARSAPTLLRTHGLVEDGTDMRTVRLPFRCLAEGKQSEAFFRIQQGAQRR